MRSRFALLVVLACAPAVGCVIETGLTEQQQQARRQDAQPPAVDAAANQPDAGTITDAPVASDAALADAHPSSDGRAPDGGRTPDASRTPDGPPPVSFASQVQPILNQNCAGCHQNATGIMAPKGLDLSAGHAYANMVGVAAVECTGGKLRVMANQPTQSYLINKVQGTGMCAGGRMPLGGAALSAADIATMTTWITQGAPNN
jgi:hypothetical protein